MQLTPLAQQYKRRLLRARALGMGMLILLETVSLWVMMEYINSQRQDVSLINIAGRQRMLTQRISKLGLWLSQHPDDSQAKAVLKANIRTWRQVQTGILMGDRSLNLRATQDSTLAHMLERGVGHMANLERTLEHLNAGYALPEEREATSQLLLIEDEICLRNCEAVTNRVAFQQESAFHTFNILQYGATGLLILMVLGIGFFVSGPASTKTSDVLNRLALQNRRYRKLVRNLKRKRLELAANLEEVTASESRYRHLVENSSDFIYEVSYNGNFIYASQSLLARLGLIKSELPTLSYMVLVRPDFRQRLQDYYQYTIDQQQASTYYEFPVIGRSGNEIWIGQSGTTLFDEEGRVTSIQFIARDLTQFHRLNTEKEQQQRMLSAVLQSAKDGICALKAILDSADETIGMEWVMANPSSNRLFGVENLVGKTLLDVLPVREAIGLRNWCAEGLASRHPREREGQYTVNGKVRWLRITSVAIPDGLVLTLADITLEKQAGQELQQQKNFYETILNHLPSEVAIFSPEQRYVFLNPAAVRNSDTRHWLIGKDDYEYAKYKGNGNERADMRKGLFSDAIQNRKVVWWEDVFQTPDGIKAFMRNFCPVFDAEGKVYMVVGNGLDITDRKHMEAELEVARVTAEASAMARQSFINSMSHEMRTPLNAVIGLTHVLLNESPRQDQAENLRAMHFSANNLLALINDVLDFGKLEAGKMELEEIPFRLNEILEGIYVAFRHQALQKGIDLRLSVPDTLPTYLVGDPIRLTQVMNNLVSNAIRFTQVGGVLLQVDDLGWHEGKLSLGFRVQDTGIGIAPEKQVAVFESFTQAEGDTTRRFGGTGLGLSIVKRLLDLYGAEIRLESAPGKGSTFAFSLRFAEARPATVAQPLSQGLVEDSPLAGMKVLLVEDNEINRMVATKFLKRWGVVPAIAVNGQDALDAVQRRSFDVVMMDLQMPILDGFAAARAIREIPGMGADDLPILALTAASNAEVEQQVYDAGMNAILTKPMNPSDLHAVLSRFYRSASSI